MFEVIGKAVYKVVFDGKEYIKIRYTLQLTATPKNVTSVDGVLTDTVCVSYNERNDQAQIGDRVVVLYNKYGKPAGLFIEK